MLDKNLLLVDIGGTNIRYAYSNIGDSGFVSENKAELDSLNDFDNLMSVLLAESDVKNIVFSEKESNTTIIPKEYFLLFYEASFH